MNTIQAHGLLKAFHTGEVLKSLDLEIPEGSIYGLLGRNGAGKTTLLRVLMGLAHRDGGSALVLGQDLSRGCPREKATVSYVGQGEILPAWAKISDLLRFERSLRETWDGTALERWLEAEHFSRSRRVSDMSVGQRKRLELELALAPRPKVLLMDEPFAGLDPVARSEIIEHLLDHAAAQPVTVLLSSHILGDLERLCDRIGVLARGVIAHEAPMDTIKESTVAISARGTSLPEKAPCDGVQIARRGGPEHRTWIVSGYNGAMTANLEAQGFQVSRSGLEELGVELIRCLESTGSERPGEAR